MERRGATIGRPTWGANHSTTDGNPHPERFVDDDHTDIVTSTIAEGANQSTPTGVQDSDGGHRSRDRRLVVRTRVRIMVRMMRIERILRKDWEDAACLIVMWVGTQTHPMVNLRQPLMKENLTDVIVAAGATRRRMTVVTVVRCAVSTASDRSTSMVRVRSSRSGRSFRIAHPTADRMMLTSWRT